MPQSITFVHCPVVDFGQNYGSELAPLWAFTLAAWVPTSFDTRVVDCRHEDPAQIERADVFAFSGINQDLPELLARRAALKARYPDALFILGGPITWSFEREGRLGLLADFDYLFLLDGEETFPRFLRALEAGRLEELERVQRAERFPLAHARALDLELYARTEATPHYYGAAVEVSRGCPFLCEFCDVRSIPGNNRANDKPVALVLAELEWHYARGVRDFMFVCDNFIGDVSWARACAEAIAEWRARTGANPSIFTWATLNLVKHAELMQLMRRAGFSVLYIGIESVNQSSLLETAKAQNRGDLASAVRRIHEHGFVIAPGLIFGFDSDGPETFDDTLAFLEQTGLLGGDPGFLSALPGTPLFARMKRTGRLVERSEGASARRKVSTNVRYLQEPAALASGFARFMARFASAEHQWRKFERHLELIVQSSHFIEQGGVGPGALWQFVRGQLAHAERRRMLLARLGFLLAKPAHLRTLVRAFFAWRKAERTRPGLGAHFYFWLYFWTNLGLKYRDLKPEDCELHGASPTLSVTQLAADARGALQNVIELDGVRSKARKQLAQTSRALTELAAASARRG